MNRSLRIALAAGVALSLTAASAGSADAGGLFNRGPKAAKAVSFAANPAVEAATLTSPENLDVLRGVRAVVIPQFTVEFVEESSGLGGAREDNVKVTYNVSGVGDAERQAVVDRLYARWVAGLAAQGLTVTGPAAAAATQAWTKIAASTRPAPAEIRRPTGVTRIFSAEGVPYLAPTGAATAPGQGQQVAGQAATAARVGGMFNSRLAGLSGVAGMASALGGVGQGIASAQNAMRYGTMEPELAAETAAAVMTVRLVVSLRDTDRPSRLFASLRGGNAMIGEPKLAILGEASSVSIFTPNPKSKRAEVAVGPDLLFADDVFEGRITLNNGAGGTASNVAARGLFLAGAVGSSFFGTPGIDLHQSHTVSCAPDAAVYTAAVEKNLAATGDMFLARLAGAW